MIIRLKAIKFREDVICYLSFYLYCSFFWQLVIITFIHCIIKLYQKRLLVLSRHRIIKALRYYISRILFFRCLLAVMIIVIVIVLIIIIWFQNCLNNCFFYTIWLTKLSFLVYKRSKTWFTALMNHALTFDYSQRSICI